MHRENGHRRVVRFAVGRKRFSNTPDACCRAAWPLADHHLGGFDRQYRAIRRLVGTRSCAYIDDRQSITQRSRDEVGDAWVSTAEASIPLSNFVVHGTWHLHSAWASERPLYSSRPA